MRRKKTDTIHKVCVTSISSTSIYVFGYMIYWKYGTMCEYTHSHTTCCQVHNQSSCLIFQFSNSNQHNTCTHTEHRAHALKHEQQKTFASEHNKNHKWMKTHNCARRVNIGWSQHSVEFPSLSVCVNFFSLFTLQPTAFNHILLS